MSAKIKAIYHRIGQQARWLALLLLLLFFWRLWHTANVKSVTMDEMLHILYGVLYWQHSSLYSVVQNPPLVNGLLGGLVNLTFQPGLPVDLPVWQTFNWWEISEVFIWEVNDNGRQLIAAGRLAVILLAMLFAALVYRWSRQLFRSQRAGLLALWLFTFDPNLLAHGHLATTDLGFAFFLALAAYLIWRYWQRSSDTAVFWSSYLPAGIGVGLALAAKFSGVLLAPALILIALYRLATTNRSWAALRRTGLELSGWAAMGSLLLLAVYRFQWEMLRRDYLWQRDHQLSGHNAFLLGELSREGWWYYFPVVWTIKTPLALLLLIGLGLVLLLGKRQSGWSIWWPLLLAAGFFAASLISRVNIGYRYLLPILPLVYVVLGQLARPRYLWGRLLPAITVTAVAIASISSLLAHPDYLAYFNQLAGGPDNAWHIVVDSNIDWGQDIQPLATYMQEQGIESVYLSYLGPASFKGYGVRGQLLPAWPTVPEEPLTDHFYPAYPAPGVYVISVTQLQGVYLEDPTRFHWFWARKPDAKVGYSLFVYDVPATGPPVNVALSDVGISHIDLADFMRAFGSNDLRISHYDARTSFLWPGGHDRSAAVWTAVSDAHLPQHPLLRAIYPAAGPHIRSTNRSMPYNLFAWSQSLSDWITTRAADQSSLYQTFYWSPEPTVSSLAWAEKRQPLDGAALFDDTFELMAYEVVESDHLASEQALELLSYWRVVQEPTNQVSLFLHLIDERGDVVAQHDGLHIATAGLQVGDEFVQLHTVWTDGLAPGTYGWQIGVYDSADPTRRLTISLPAQPQAADRLLLHTISLGE